MSAKPTKPKKPAHVRWQPPKAQRPQEPITVKLSPPPPRKTGRPCLLDETKANQLIRILQSGHTIETACSAVGVTSATFYLWIERGKKDKTGSFFEFSEAVAKARGLCAVSLINNIERAGQKDWRASAWLAERMFRDQFGERSAVEVAHSGTLAIAPITFVMPETFVRRRGEGLPDKESPAQIEDKPAPETPQ